MYAKIFRQIYESSIAENPTVRFTFMDLLVLSDKDGIVDMTHESIARITNRPLDEIRQTIAILESPDVKSRNVEFEGRRIKRLDDHRDWGWVILNYDRFREIATEQQRREKTRERVRKHRENIRKSEGVTTGNAPVTQGNAKVTPVYVSVSECTGTVPITKNFEESPRMVEMWSKWIDRRMKKKKPSCGWKKFFLEQSVWLAQFDEPTAFSILETSVINDYQGLFPVKGNQRISSANKESASQEVQRILKGLQ